MSVSITQAINGTLTLITVGREIYEAVTELMDVVQAEGGNGSNKKAWVMAATKHIILEGGRNWVDILPDLKDGDSYC